MDSCLFVPEIVVMIIQNLSRDSRNSQLGKRILNVGLSYRPFLEPALDRLWRCQVSLVPLIKTLPDKSWWEDVIGVLHLVRYLAFTLIPLQSNVKTTVISQNLEAIRAGSTWVLLRQNKNSPRSKKTIDVEFNRLR